jgi:hypothetical protein
MSAHAPSAKKRKRSEIRKPTPIALELMTEVARSCEPSLRQRAGDFAAALASYPSRAPGERADAAEADPR